MTPISKRRRVARYALMIFTITGIALGIATFVYPTEEITCTGPYCGYPIVVYPCWCDSGSVTPASGTMTISSAPYWMGLSGIFGILGLAVLSIEYTEPEESLIEPSNGEKA